MIYNKSSSSDRTALKETAVSTSPGVISFTLVTSLLPTTTQFINLVFLYLLFSRTDTVAGREPESIQNAECTVCTVPGMIAKPITFQIHVYKLDKDNKTWKRCPYDVAVGCTCVRE